MKKFIFILGGARSGKSSYAVELAKKLKGKVTFVATALAFDREMKERIKLHKLSRPRNWNVVEEDRDVREVLAKLNHAPYERCGVKGVKRIVLIDCLGLLISNLLAANLSDKEIEMEINELLEIITKSEFTTILVSNEVGGGIVPANVLARRFRDLVGIANQMAAGEADEVIFMHAGIAMKLKSQKSKGKNLKNAGGCDGKVK